MRSGLNAKRSRGNRSDMRRGPGHHRSQAVDSSGPNVKIRGSASQLFEKYLSLARDANASDDRVMAENYLQHAEHYYRVVNGDGSGQRQNQHQQRQVAEQPRISEQPQPADATPKVPLPEPQS